MVVSDSVSLTVVFMLVCHGQTPWPKNKTGLTIDDFIRGNCRRMPTFCFQQKSWEKVTPEGSMAESVALLVVDSVSCRQQSIPIS